MNFFPRILPIPMSIDTRFALHSGSGRFCSDLLLAAHSAGSSSSGPLLRTLFTRPLTIRGVRFGSGRESSRCWMSALSIRSGSSHSPNRSRGMIAGDRSWTWLIWGWFWGESRRRGVEIRSCLPFILGV